MIRPSSAIAAGLLFLCFQASAQEKADTSFTQALNEAKRLADTDPGKAYDSEFSKIVAPRLSDVVGGCTKNFKPPIDFAVVFIFNANGQVEQVLTPSDQPAAVCVGDKLRDLHLPAPPRASWPVQLSIHITPNQASAALSVALKVMESGTWEVDATISRAFNSRVHGLLAGEDFDLTVEPKDRNAVRQIAIKDKLWASYDGNTTWKIEASNDQATYRRMYARVHNPIRWETQLPPFEVVGKETHDGENWLHLRRKVSGNKTSELQQTNYWIVLREDNSPTYVGHYEGPVTEPGHENEPLHCVATYRRADNKTIQPPANVGAPQ